MSNPLIDKYEELYGEKKEEEIVEEKKSPLSVKELTERYASSIGLPGGMGDDHIIFSGGGSDTISLNPAHAKVGLSINGGQEILDSGAFVIPAATVTNTGLHMDGSYMSPNTIISSTKPAENTFTIPNKCVKDEMLCKVLKDLESGKATVYNISSQVDKSFTGFGGQICYSIEIVSTYP